MAVQMAVKMDFGGTDVVINTAKWKRPFVDFRKIAALTFVQFKIPFRKNVMSKMTDRAGKINKKC